MKFSYLSKLVAMALLAMATVSFVFTPTPAFAQVKGAQRLMPLRTEQDLTNVQAGDIIVMTCPKCKETYAAVVDPTAKGALEKAKNVPVHLCPTCETRITTKGVGKAAKNTLVHKCSKCGSEKVTCCVLKKDALPTPGMEEKK